jgi:hypothetical protein
MDKGVPNTESVVPIPNWVEVSIMTVRKTGADVETDFRLLHCLLLKANTHGSGVMS